MDAPPAYQSSWVKGPDQAAARTRTTSRWKRPSLCNVLRQWSQEYIRYDTSEGTVLNGELLLYFMEEHAERTCTLPEALSSLRLCFTRHSRG